jgi:hypothetical protein
MEPGRLARVAKRGNPLHSASDLPGGGDAIRHSRPLYPAACAWMKIVRAGFGRNGIRSAGEASREGGPSPSRPRNLNVVRGAVPTASVYVWQVLNQE